METLTSRRWNVWAAIALPYKDYSMDFKWSRSVMSDSLQPHGPGSSAHWIFQVRVLEWVAISFSTGSSQPRDRTWVSHIAGRCITSWTTREATWREARVAWQQRSLKARPRLGCRGPLGGTGRAVVWETQPGGTQADVCQVGYWRGSWGQKKSFGDKLRKSDGSRELSS